MPIDKTRIKYFTIRWTALVSLIDSAADVDDEPDTDFITGIITLRPAKKNLVLQYRHATDPFTVVPMQRRITVDSGTFSDQTRTYVKLEAASVDAVPTQWFWEAIFDLNYKGTPIVIPNIQFMGLPGTTVDFTNELPVFDAVTQVEYARGPQGFGIQRIEISGPASDRMDFYSSAPGNPLMSSVTFPSLTSAADSAGIAVTASELSQQFKNAAQAAQAQADIYRQASVDAATLALTYRNTAETHKNTATTQAGIATTKAQEAAASAEAAGQAVIGQIPNGSLRHQKFAARDMTNLMPSGDFEVDWTLDLDAAPTFAWAYDTSKKWEGSRSIRLTGTTGTGTGKAIPTSPGEVFMFSLMQSADAAVTGPGGMRIQALVGSTWSDVASVKAQRADISSVTNFNVFEKAYMISVMPAGALAVRWRLAYALTAANPGFNYDELDFRRIPEILAPGIVQLADLASNSVDSSKIVDGSIVNADLSSTAGITGGKLASQTITSAQLANDAVITTRILDLNVTLAKLAANSVDSSKIVDRSIATTDIALLAVTAAEIANLTITAAKIANATITATQIANGAIGTLQLLDANVTLAKLANNSVDSSKIVDGSIVNADIATAAAIAISKLETGWVKAFNNGVANNLNIWYGTEAQYAAITTKDPGTLYFRSA